MRVIGLTGGIGSGKSTVAALFAAKGISVIDADALSREAVNVGSQALAQIAKRFGPDILASDGSLQRSKLRHIVFADEQHRLWLERLLHPLIADGIKAGIATCASSYCIVESPLLLETGQHKLADRILLVDVSEKTQLQRTLQRDGSDRATVEAIIASQMPRKQRLQRADDVICNEHGQDELSDAVDKLHARYMAMAGAK